MKLLALDTSTEWVSVALFDGRRVVAERERAGNASSERVLPLIGRMLAQDGTPLAAVDGIAFGAGPGSFTGVRIACGVAQGLAFGADLPVFAVPTLGAIAHAAWRLHGTPRVIACLDARMREVYVAAYARNESAWTLASEPAVRRPDDIEAPAGGQWHGAGNGFAVYPQLAQRLCLAGFDPLVIPDAQSIAEWAWPQLLAGEGVPAERAEPLYVRHRVALTTAERAAGARL
ncbi:MAG TPA: tRNA (adenosine(37)-N6)-threonylcarbamoyltransferase complex dimerization subunit type 1 TsaB [Casimicrobiaceae bacterium]